MIIENDRKYALIIGAVIINECLDKGYKINTSKLMKLLYYMQKLHILKYDEPMFTNEIIACETGPCILDVREFFCYGMLGFNEKIKRVITLMDSHKDVANIVLKEYGALSPTELMLKSLEDNAFKTIWQDGVGNNQVIPLYYLMADSKKDTNMKILSKNNKKVF